MHDDGKGFIGGHASIIAFYDWPEFGDLMGGFMDGEYPVSPTHVLVDDPKFPGTDAFGSAFEFNDQFPYLKAPYAKGKVHTIMRLDASRLTDAQKSRHADADLPVVWARTYGKGRVFYSSFGHLDASWDDPRVQHLYLEAIRWALGVTNADIALDSSR